MKKKIVFSRKQVTMYELEIQRINTLQTLHQGVNSKCFRRKSFQLQSWAMEIKEKPLNDAIVDYSKKL